MSKLKHKIEAILFSAGKRVKLEEIAKLVGTSTSMAYQTLTELKEDYANRDSSLLLVEEGDSWKIVVKDDYLPVIRNIVTETELTKTVMETLAVIAFKYPIKQADLIKIRTNKAYDHLKELEEMGYITRQKYGRSKLIKLTQKFFEYFDLAEEDLKDKFSSFESIAKAIENKESEIENIKKEQQQNAKQEKETDERIKQEIQLLDDEGNKVHLEVDESSNGIIKEKIGNLDVVSDSVEESMSKTGEKLGNLDVVDEPSEEEIERDMERIRRMKEEDRKRSEQKAKEEQEREDYKKIQKLKEERKKKGESFGVELTEEQEKEVEARVNEIFSSKEEQQKNIDTEKKENNANLPLKEQHGQEAEESNYIEDGLDKEDSGQDRQKDI